MNDWPLCPACPECASNDTHLIESFPETVTYECDACGCHFEIEKEE